MADMRELIVGSANSGKSLRAEQLLEAIDSTRLVYFATLPPSADRAGRIARHQERRRDRWETIEIFGDISDVVEVFQRQAKRPEPVLLDGLSIIFWRIMRDTPSRAASNLPYLASELLENLSKFEADWIIVDHDIPYPLLPRSDPFNAFMEDYHARLRKIV